MRSSCALPTGTQAADIVLLQTGIEKTIRTTDLHAADYAAWEVRVVTA